MSEFNEIEQRLKSAQNRFQLSAGLNLEKLNTILSGTNYIKFKPRLKLLKIRPLDMYILEMQNTCF